MLTHARRSVAPERLADALLDDADDRSSTEQDYWDLTHLTDNIMTDQEIRELPKVWVIGGDGALGDIGFQNVSKVILQNRPNVKSLMLDTQVYSNTGGQNSDSSTMLGGYDMNQFGRASQGKLTEKKSVAEILTSGHGSPLRRPGLDGQRRQALQGHARRPRIPRHRLLPVLHHLPARARRRRRHVAPTRPSSSATRRGMPEFVFDPQLGETRPGMPRPQGQPHARPRLVAGRPTPATSEKYNYTVAHWATTEAPLPQAPQGDQPEEAAELIPLDDMLVCITQDDVVKRRVFDPNHRTYVPDFGVYIIAEIGGKKKHVAVSRQIVLFCVERRKAWRMLQSKAGIENPDYDAQRALLKKVDAGEISIADLRAKPQELLAG